MKKIIAALIILAAGISGLSADDSPLTLYISPGIYGTLGSEDVLRGLAAGVDAKLDLFDVITPGIQAFFEYDGYFDTANIPIMLELGFGPDFWIGVGTTLSVTSASLNGVSYSTSGVFNTYGIGSSLPVIPLGGKSSLKLAAQVTYTLYQAIDSSGNIIADQLNQLAAILASLKGYAGIQLELGL